MTEPTTGTELVPARRASTHPLAPWGLWIVRWFTAMLANVYVVLAVYLAIDSGRPQDLVALVLYVPVIALFVAMMTLVASLLRWALSRLAPPRVGASIVAVVGLGSLSGSLALFLFFASGDPRMFVEPARAGLDVVFAPPTVLGGGVASYLAERQVPVRRPLWWVAVLAAAAIGLLLLEPVRSLFSL